MDALQDVLSTVQYEAATIREETIAKEQTRDEVDELIIGLIKLRRHIQTVRQQQNKDTAIIQNVLEEMNAIRRHLTRMWDGGICLQK